MARREIVELLVAKAPARKRAVQHGRDPDSTPQAKAAAGMVAQQRRRLSQRIDGRRSGPFGGDYDPLAGMRWR